jgi:7,8-dihydropterin-6-yl-methyl-4-(beta-D-ribofuranosyl)aminobenzene 5'-phosphate synthase
MRISIIYDDTVYRKNLTADHGFACLVEVFEPVKRRILFDAGADGKILLDNMEKLDISPGSIDEVFISHAHLDHTGGLSVFLNENEKVTVFVPPVVKGIHRAKEVIHIAKAGQLHENVYSTGELLNVEQSLIVKIDKGLVIIAGCSHPGIGNILAAATQFGKPYTLIGGFHGFNEFELLEDLAVVCPTHCTRYVEKIKSLYPEKYIQGGVGKIIELLPD